MGNPRARRALRLRPRQCLRVACLGLLMVAGTSRAQEGGGNLAALSLEELADVQVTSVSRVAEPLRSAAAAIYVITEEDIRRSGVTTLAEALRLAPNLRLTQLGAGEHVVSARGFGGAQEAQNFSNKMLMLIDGRSVYSPLFSGISLDTQDVLLSDVSRIEVISGPGASLWGANAMNGVINVITRPAYLTQGTVVSAVAGADEQLVGLRHGRRLGEAGSWRMYGKALRHDAADLEPGVGAGDAWRRAQAGFRMDLADAAGGGLTLQADAYRGRAQRPGPDSALLTGANMLARWDRQSGRAGLSVQAYFDHVQRDTRLQEDVRVNTFDLEVQQQLLLGRHSLIWGAGARLHRYHIRPSAGLQFVPPERSLQLWNLFAQDTVTLGEQTRLTLGLKLEHNRFSGWEPQPEMRIAWQPTASMLLWASAARAIRSPTPFDTDVAEFVDGIQLLEGDPGFRPETVGAYEAGLRMQVGGSLRLSASLFHNRYDDLRTVEWGDAPAYLPLRWGNGMHGQTQGIDAWATWQVAPWWRLTPGVALVRKKLRFDAASFSPLGLEQSGNDPRGHARLTSSMDLGRSQLLEISVRHVGRLPQPHLSAHTALSARYARRITSALELSLRGVNLLRRHHREYPAGHGRLIRREVMIEARWSH